MEKKVLVLGAGMVTKPMIRFFAEKTDYSVVVASRTKAHIDEIISGYKRVKGIVWEASDEETLKGFIKEADIVLSFLPYIYHLQVAKLCVEYKKPLVTTSYVKDEMANLDELAKERGVLLLNEIGLDPGIDHMTAQMIIDGSHRENGRIEEFYSYCGALPAPQYANNPLSYKFSWSPEGVIRAGNNSARYFKDGKIMEVSSDELFKHRWKEYVGGIGELEVYPNRDSLVYIDKYNIHEVKTIIRGTFRYPGWCETQIYLKKLHLTDEHTKVPEGITTWKQLMKVKLKEIRENIPDAILDKLRWLGLFDDRELYCTNCTIFENFVMLLKEKLSYREGEKDMIVLKHKIITKKDGIRKLKTVSLISEGVIGGETAVAKTVSLPASIAVDLILKGKIDLKGVWIPTHPTIYEEVLKELQEEGIKPVYEEHVLADVLEQ